MNETSPWIAKLLTIEQEPNNYTVHAWTREFKFVVEKRKLAVRTHSHKLSGLSYTRCCYTTRWRGKKLREISAKQTKEWNYDRLKEEILCNKDRLIGWLVDEKLIANSRKCGHCNEMMKLVIANDRSDGFKWECRGQINGKQHRVKMSIRKDSWFEKSNLTLVEIVKLTYWWCRGVSQEEIRHEVNVSEHTALDWDSFCRETCEVTLLEREDKIGGPGKTVQIYESKFGKRKYHRGHKVERQWVFGGIEEESA